MCKLFIKKGFFLSNFCQCLRKAICGIGSANYTFLYLLKEADFSIAKGTKQKSNVQVIPPWMMNAPEYWHIKTVLHVIWKFEVVFCSKCRYNLTQQNLLLMYFMNAYMIENTEMSHKFYFWRKTLWMGISSHPQIVNYISQVR